MRKVHYNTYAEAKSVVDEIMAEVKTRKENTRVICRILYNDLSCIEKKGYYFINIKVERNY